MKLESVWLVKWSRKEFTVRQCRQWKQSLNTKLVHVICKMTNGDGSINAEYGEIRGYCTFRSVKLQLCHANNHLLASKITTVPHNKPHTDFQDFYFTTQQTTSSPPRLILSYKTSHLLTSRLLNCHPTNHHPR